MYRLHCFGQSGNAFKVAFMLRALGQDFEPVFVDFFNGATRDPAWRGEHNAMGEAPVLEDGATVLTQSGVILHYLADKHGRFGGATLDEKRDILRWILFDNHKFTSYFASYRFTKSFIATEPNPAVMAWLKGRIDTAFGIVDKHLATHKFMVGDGPTIADFSMCGYMFFPKEESGIDLAAQYPHIAAWTERLKQIEGWEDPYTLMPGERIAPRW